MVSPCTVAVVLFEGFEVLDVFGPVELLSRVPGWSVTFLGPATDQPVRSAQGADVVARSAFTDLDHADILLVPGGPGTRPLVRDLAFLRALCTLADRSSTVASVCTGSALLAAAGLLDGRRATSNKLAWAWASSQGHSVAWVPQARWVVDGNFWTSSGVAAGMDMAHALITAINGVAVADRIAKDIELEVHRDPDLDPFSGIHGVV